MRKLAGVVLFWMGLMSIAPLAGAQDQYPELQQKLNGLYTLTKVSADGNDVVTAGSVLVLHKDGLHLCSTQARLPITSSYKDGRLSAGMGKWGMEEGLLQSDLPTAQIPQKVFDEGEKIWVASVTAGKSGIVLKVFSDPHDDIRYYGQIEIPFDKKAKPADDELLKRLAEVVTVDVPTEAKEILPPGAAAPAASPKEQIRAKLAEMLVLSKGDLKTNSITKPGSVLELRKDGLVLWTVESGVQPTYIYKNGKYTMPANIWLQRRRELMAKDPALNPTTVVQRKFVAGEKVWIFDCKVRDDAVFLLLVSDAYSDVRYYGELAFPFDKQGPPPVDVFLKTLAEHISVEAPPAQEQAAAAPPVAPAAPAVAPIAAPPAPPKTVTLGQTRDEVQTILGQPQKVVLLGTKEIEIYPDMRITLIKGKVTDVVVK